MSKKYEESGVSLQAGYESVERIKKHVARTKNLGMMSAIGGFGGVFDLSSYNFKNPSESAPIISQISSFVLLAEISSSVVEISIP